MQRQSVADSTVRDVETALELLQDQKKSIAELIEFMREMGSYAPTRETVRRALWRLWEQGKARCFELSSGQESNSREAARGRAQSWAWAKPAGKEKAEALATTVRSLVENGRKKEEETPAKTTVRIGWKDATQRQHEIELRIKVRISISFE